MPLSVDGEREVGFTDIHHHLIYGIDADGPKTFQDMCDMMNAARADGIRRIIATPHVTPGIRPFDMDAFLHKVDAAREVCKREGLGLDIDPGAEILYTEMTPRFLKERRIPTMSGSLYVLVEFSPTVPIQTMFRALDNLSRSGYIPILAHAERYHCFTLHFNRTRILKRHINLRFQINCSSILPNSPFMHRRFCAAMLREGGVDIVATDAHNVLHRAVAMRRAYNHLLAKYGLERAGSLTGTDGSFVLNHADRL